MSNVNKTTPSVAIDGTDVNKMTDHDKELREKLERLDIEFLRGVPVHLPENSIDDLMALITTDRERAVRKARVESLQWALNDFNMPDTDTAKNLQEFIDVLATQEGEKDNG